MKRHFLSKRLFAILAVCLLLVTILCAGLFQAAAASENFVDDLTDLSKVSSKSDGWDVFPKHADTQLSVIGKKTAAAEYVTYMAAGKAISSIELSVQIADGFFLASRDVKVEVRLAGGTDFTVLDMTAAEPVYVSTNANGQKFSTVAMTPTAALAENVEEVKITFLTDVPWTSLLNKVELTYVEAAAAPTTATSQEPTTTTTQEPTTTTTVEEPAVTTTSTEAPTAVTTTKPEATTTEFVDDFTTNDKMSDKSEGWDLFADHAETHLSVLGKKSAAAEYVSYKMSGNTISDFALSLQMANGFFELDRDVKVEVRASGSDTFTQVELQAAEPVAITGNATFSTVAVSLKDALPADTEEVKITLLNDVAWTLFLDQVRLTYVGEGATATTGGSNESPSTGAAFPVVPALLGLTAVAGAGIVLAKKKQG